MTIEHRREQRQPRSPHPEGAVHVSAVEPVASHLRAVPEALVDIVVPVYDALDDVRRCIESLITHSGAPTSRIVIVNDGSGAETTEYLRKVARQRELVRLVEHARNRGYTKAVNTGLRESRAPYVILLNSDTIVTEGWLAGLLRCADSAERMGIVGPLSNAASWQSVPQLLGPDGRFAVNALPAGLVPDDVAKVVAESSSRDYPRVPFVNGFCFLIKRSVIEAIGIMDDVAFPVGYGEENDYCIRAADAGFDIAIADDVYVFHAKSKSFGHGRRRELSRAGMNALRAKHGDCRIDSLIDQVKSQTELHAIRSKVGRALPDGARADRRIDPLRLKILFLLPVKGGSGGANSVIQEAVGMRRLGVHVTIAVRQHDHGRLCKMYKDIPRVDELFVGVDQQGLLDLAQGHDVAIATIFKSIDDLALLTKAYPELLPAYYVQDYEPMFFEKGTPDWEHARRSYSELANALLFAKTRWIGEQVRRFHGVEVQKVEASIDHDVYFPAPGHDESHVRIAAMVRPQTPRRAAARTMRVLREVVHRHPGKVAVHVFGCPSSDPRFEKLPRNFPFVNYGVLVRPQVAALLRKSDIFVDLSDYQAFGRTGLEAMASGCVAVIPAEGGTNEYARDGQNSVVVNTLDDDECVRRISDLIENPAQLARLRAEGLATAAKYSIHRAAVSELTVLAEGLAKHRREQAALRRRRLMLLPARYPSGELAARAHVRLLGPWRTAAIRRSWLPEVRPEGELPPHDAPGIAIVQRGAALPRPNELYEWLTAWRAAGGRLVFDVDDAVFDPLGTRFRLAPGESEQEAGQAEWLATLADAVLVPSATAQAIFRDLNANVYLIPTRLDPAHWFPPQPPRVRSTPGGVIRIGCILDPKRGDDLNIIAPAIDMLAREHGERISIEVVGGWELVPPRFGTRVGLPRRRAYNEYVDWLHRRVSWDIALLPAGDNRSGHAALRFLEYSALGLPTVCSGVDGMDQIVRHGETGLLVPNHASAWYGAIQRLIREPHRRQALGRAAHHHARTTYALDTKSEAHLAVLDDILALPRRLDVPLDLSGSAPSHAPRATTTVQELFQSGPAEPESTRPRMPTSPACAPHQARPRPRWQRKFNKLKRDPERFCADSRWRVVRSMGTFVRLTRGRT